MARIHRLVRGAAVLGASALVASCSFMTPIQTTELYNAGDGVRVEVSERVRVENLMVLTAEEGGEGQVLGALVNDTSDEVTIGLTIADGGIEIAVPAGESVLLGPEELVVIPAVPTAPGGLAEGFVRASGHGTVSAAVPVLDSTLPQYADHVP